MNIEITESVERRFWARVNKDGPIQDHCKELGKCWTWTAGKVKGYGRIHASGKPRYATHVALAIHGIQNTNSLCALHKCDNPSCVNPSHLYYGTDADNHADMVSRGRSFAGFKIIPCPPEKRQKGELASSSKLSNNQVLEIVELVKAGNRHRDIAKKFGVAKPQISMIMNGKTWSSVTGFSRPNKPFGHKLSVEDVEKIRELIASKSMKQKEIAVMFQVTATTICQIKTGLIHPIKPEQ